MSEKLVKQLKFSNEKITDARAERLAKVLESSQRSLENDLENAIFKMENELEDIMDLNKTNSTSLQFKNIEDGDAFIRGIHTLKVEISLKKAELKIAKETRDSLFGEE